MAACSTTRVSPTDFQSHIQLLASDELAGRGVGTDGIDLAAGYIAGQFASMGIEPGAPDGSYFQQFEQTTGAKLDDDFEFAVTGVDVNAKRGEDFTPFPFSDDAAFDGDVVFVGYGIIDEDLKHDDYANVDVEGQVVLMLRRQPSDWGNGGRGQRRAMFRNKIYTAREHGAAAVLIVDREEDPDRLMPFRTMGGSGDFGLPAFHVKRDLADAMLSAGGLESLSTLQAKLDSGSHASAALTGVRLRGKAGIVKTKTDVRNVVGIIRGEGPLANEYVVIGGHYDHLGTAVPRAAFGFGQGSGEPEIHNGADDNASGTAGVIEAGRMLVAQKPLKRSVLLITFTGEETGLNGSRYFVDHPPVPIENMVAMLNMDMIGRLDKEKNTVTVFGTGAATEFAGIVERETKKEGLKLRADISPLGPSDHTSFYQKKIPALHFFTGLHSDYHRPGDDIEKINADGGARVTELVVAIADDILKSDRRPTYAEVTQRANIFGQPQRQRRGQGDQDRQQAEAMAGMPSVVMGIMPGYADTGEEGMLVDGVSEGGPAASAGVQNGDRILKIGDTEVDNIQDYMGALRNKKDGEVVSVVVKRKDERVEFQVKLVGR